MLFEDAPWGYALPIRQGFARTVSRGRGVSHSPPLMLTALFVYSPPVSLHVCEGVGQYTSPSCTR